MQSGRNHGDQDGEGRRRDLRDAPRGHAHGGQWTDELELKLRRLLDDEKKILLDLRNTTHMNSMAIGRVFGVHMSAVNRGVAFFVCNIDRRIESVLVIFTLVKVLKVYDTREDALAAFAKL